MCAQVVLGEHNIKTLKFAKATALFRQMQLMDPEEVIKLLPGVEVERYSPLKSTRHFVSFWNKFLKSWANFKDKTRKLFSPKVSSLKKRKTSIIKNEATYQKEMWKRLEWNIQNVIQSILQSPKNLGQIHGLSSELRFLDLRHVFCPEQVMQVAILENLRLLSEQELEVLLNHIATVENSILEGNMSDVPRFLPEIRRALALTIALRKELNLLRAGKRMEPKTPLASNVEFRLQ